MECRFPVSFSKLSRIKELKMLPKFQLNFSIWDAIFVAPKVKKNQNNDEKRQPQILCRGIGTFVKDKTRLSFNITV